MVVFAKQDVLKDPPFSRLDLISCRNLLIYLDGEAQKKIAAAVPLCAEPGRLSLPGQLGNDRRCPDLFADVDKKWRIYRRETGSEYDRCGARCGVPDAGCRLRQGPPGGRRLAEGQRARPGGTRLLESITPASVLINADCEVLYIHGHTGKYLEPASGEASLNLLRMAREGLRLELTAAVRQAIAQQTAVRYDGLHVKTNLAGVRPRGAAVVNLIVQPVTAPESTHAAC